MRQHRQPRPATPTAPDDIIAHEQQRADRRATSVHAAFAADRTPAAAARLARTPWYHRRSRVAQLITYSVALGIVLGGSGLIIVIAIIWWVLFRTFDGVGIPIFEIGDDPSVSPAMPLRSPRSP